MTKFSDYGHNRQFSNSYCNAQFTCDAAAIPNQRINIVFGLRRRWSVAARPVTDVLFTAFKAMGQHQTELTWCPHHTSSQMSISLHGTGASSSKKLIHNSLPSTYAHKIRHCARLPCRTHVTGRSTDNPGEYGQCRCSVD